MSPPAVLAGLGFGLSVTATAALAWSGLGQADDTWRASTARGTRLIGWLATALLLAAGCALWADSRSLSVLSLRLTILAAAAAPSEHSSVDHHWSHMLERLPSMLLAGLALLQIVTLPLGHSRADTVLETAVTISVGLLICGGLAARVVVGALRRSTTLRLDRCWWTPVAAYALLTVLTGGTAFSSLIQYGSLWTDGAAISPLAATWLAWNAMWLADNAPSRLHAGLVGASGLLLVGAALIIG